VFEITVIACDCPSTQTNAPEETRRDAFIGVAVTSSDHGVETTVDRGHKNRCYAEGK